MVIQQPVPRRLSVLYFCCGKWGGNALTVVCLHVVGRWAVGIFCSDFRLNWIINVARCFCLLHASLLNGALLLFCVRNVSYVFLFSIGLLLIFGNKNVLLFFAVAYWCRWLCSLERLDGLYWYSFSEMKKRVESGGAYRWGVAWVGWMKWYGFIVFAQVWTKQQLCGMAMIW